MKNSSVRFVPASSKIRSKLRFANTLSATGASQSGSGWGRLALSTAWSSPTASWSRCREFSKIFWLGEYLGQGRMVFVDSVIAKFPDCLNISLIILLIESFFFPLASSVIKCSCGLSYLLAKEYTLWLTRLDFSFQLIDTYWLEKWPDLSTAKT